MKTDVSLSNPPAKSRRQFDRTEALQTATELFWRHGYEATSMAMLLKAMGLTAPSLYGAFGNKDQLFRESLGHYAKIYGAKVYGSLDDESLTTREAIESLLMNSAATVASGKNPPGCLLSFGAMNTSEASEPTALFLREIRRESERRFRARIERGVREHELPKSTNVARLAKFYFGVLGGIQLLSVDGASKTELQDMAKDAMALWPSGR